MVKNQFRGRFEVKMDGKGRLSLPAGLRQTLPDNTSLVVTNSQFQNRRCLDVYPFPAWQALEERVAQMPQLKKEVQAFRRFYLASGHHVDLDGNYRLLLPPSLRKYADIQSGLVVIGMGEKFEIWADNVWVDLHEDLASGFEANLGLIAAFEEER